MSVPEILGTVECAASDVTGTFDVQVRLEDTTMLDAPAVLVAQVACRLEPGRPARFTLRVPDEALDARRAYTLSARAGAPGRGARPRLGTVQSYPWLIGDNRPSRLELHRLDQD